MQTNILRLHKILKLMIMNTFLANTLILLMRKIVFPPATLFVTNHTKIDYDLRDGTQVRVYAIKAKELLKLQGIQDRTLFYKNVRYGVGNTRVNKDIKGTIEKPDEHKKIFLIP